MAKHTASQYGVSKNGVSNITGTDFNRTTTTTGNHAATGKPETTFAGSAATQPGQTTMGNSRATAGGSSSQNTQSSNRG